MRAMGKHRGGARRPNWTGARANEGHKPSPGSPRSGCSKQSTSRGAGDAFLVLYNELYPAGCTLAHRRCGSVQASASPLRVGGLGGGALLLYGWVAWEVERYSLPYSLRIRVPRVCDRRYVTACSVTLCVWAPTRYCVAPLCGALAPGCLVCPSSFPCVLLGLAGVCSVCV